MTMHASSVCLALCSLTVGAAPELRAQYVEPGVSRLFALPGRQVGDLFGWRIRSVGDTNGDGIADFAVAAPFNNLNVGRVSVHSGSNGSQLWAVDGGATSSIMGFDLAVAGDIDGDGVRDIVASAPFGNNTHGIVLVCSGSNGAVLHTFAGTANNVDLGYSIAVGGDYDGDGIPDIAIAADADSTVRASGGRVYVYSTVGFGLVATIDPPAGGYFFGTSLAFVGDTDGDGRDELAIGDRVSTTGSTGRMHLVGFNGTANAVHWTATGLEFGSAIDGNKFAGGADIDGDGVPDVIVDEGWPMHRARLFAGSNGAVLHTFTDLGNDEMGKGAKIVPDQNHDGVPDILMGAPQNSSVARWNGRLVLFSGRDFRRLRQITNTTADALFGNDADLMPDVSGDGWPDLAVAAQGASGFVRSMGGMHLIVGDPGLAGAQNYGRGLAGTNGVPELRLTDDPVVGSTTTLVIGNSANHASLGMLLLGNQAQSLPTAWGGTLLLVPFVESLFALPAGGLPTPIAIPLDPALQGTTLLLQSLQLDSGAGAGIAETRGLAVTFGR
jgi:hypothetical protein